MNAKPARQHASGRGLRRLGVIAGVAGLAFFACREQPISVQEIEALQASEEYERSIEPLRQRLRENPEDARLQFLYGRALWLTNRPGLALWALKSAMRDPEYRFPAGKLLVNTQILAEAWSDAEAICDEMLEADSEGEHTSEILTLRAYARQGSRQNYEGAIEDADRALALDPDNHDALIPRTVALLILERVDEAADALKRLDELYRDGSLGVKGSGKFCTASATFAYEKGEPELARERFDRCLEEFPTHPVLLSKAIEFFDQRQELSRSIEILERALAEEPVAPEIRENLAARLESAGRREDAITLLTQATRHESIVAQVQAWSTLASFHSSIGRLDEAIEAYQEARSRLTTASSDLDFRFADILIRAAREEEALAFAENLTVPAHRVLIRGRALLVLGRPAEALAELGEANRLWPNNAVARYYTAVAAEQVGDLERAIEEYRYSVRIDSGATDAAIRLANFYVARGEPARAVNTLSLGKETQSNALEMQLAIARILAQRGALREIPNRLSPTMSTPAFGSRTAAAMADGIRDRDGVLAAVRFLERLEKVDLADPQNTAILRRLVEWLPEIERAPVGLELATRARDANPADATHQALYAAALAGTGALDDVVRGEFEKALAIDAAQPVALRGLADLIVRSGSAKGEDAERVVDLYQRAIELEPQDDRASRSLAAFRASQGQLPEAIGVLEDLLERRPWDPEASLLLAGALLDADAEGNRERARQRLTWARQLAGFPGTRPESFGELERRLGQVPDRGNS